ncbi:filament-like plant protein [Andrographis paniculata]|uniref:filament-like plant protein n=1 Tax=Andrographis paniculata TaxID=175694 RepID=UPI0021E98EA3|nr:filament-like plant protein [Andrographis paniculata]XP_051124101.1 filament-like plant protein [Andrographis paniculata]
MEKKKWPWKRRSSERSPGDSESPVSGSSSSQSERYSDEQGSSSKESSKDDCASPDIITKAADDELQETIKNLTEKLSAALVNVSAKEDLVKQHAKVAEEAVAGWEQAENEVVVLKQQLEAAEVQNSSMEVRITHLDGALKECVRQLRQARDEQAKLISDAVEERGREWELTKAKLEERILELQAEAEAARIENAACIDPKFLLIVETLEKENSLLKQEVMSKCKEIEAIRIERDLSTQTAEAASKMQLESVKKIAKLEAECRRLQSAARKLAPVSNSKTCFYAESLTDSHSDSGERSQALDNDQSCSDSWASALITELDQFKSKPLQKAITTCSFEIDMMDDFLEMERLAAMPDTKNNTPFTASESVSGESSSCTDNHPLRGELDSTTQRLTELEKKLEKMEVEKAELERTLDEKQTSLEAAQHRMAELETKLEDMQKDLNAATEAKELLEAQLIGAEAETRTMSANICSLKKDIEKERCLSSELTVRCRELENDLSRTVQECNTNSDDGAKLKEEGLAVAADKLAECQRTIASLGKQLKSLATLEDFLIDTSNIPGFSKLPSSGTINDTEPSRETSRDTICVPDENGRAEESAAKNRNGFGKFFLT